MGFPILVRWHLFIESGPWFFSKQLANNADDIPSTSDSISICYQPSCNQTVSICTSYCYCLIRPDPLRFSSTLNLVLVETKMLNVLVQSCSSIAMGVMCLLNAWLLWVVLDTSLYWWYEVSFKQGQITPKYPWKTTLIASIMMSKGASHVRSYVSSSTLKLSFFRQDEISNIWLIWLTYSQCRDKFNIIVYRSVLWQDKLSTQYVFDKCV